MHRMRGAPSFPDDRIIDLFIFSAGLPATLRPTAAQGHPGISRPALSRPAQRELPASHRAPRESAPRGRNAPANASNRIW
jgi:hypothetical protein